LPDHLALEILLDLLPVLPSAQILNKFPSQRESTIMPVNFFLSKPP